MLAGAAAVALLLFCLQLHDGAARRALLADDNRRARHRHRLLVRRVGGAVARRPRWALARGRRRRRRWLGVALAVRRSAATRPRGRVLRVRQRIRVRVRNQLVARGRRRLGLGRLLVAFLGLGLGLRRRLGDLDALDDLACLAPELAGELVRVKGPRHKHPVLPVHDLLDVELASVLNGGQHLLDLGAAAAAIHVQRDGQRRHLLHFGSRTTAPKVPLVQDQTIIKPKGN
ncbi:unnamed protein product [Alopecurus aequalis]